MSTQLQTKTGGRIAPHDRFSNIWQILQVQIPGSFTKSGGETKGKGG